jgi:hypothetical protein
MKDIFNFASNHPFLTFFLALIIGEVIIKSVTVISGTKIDDDESN